MALGTIVSLANPKPMKASVEYGFTFLIDASAAILKVGTSEDFSYCTSTKISNATTILPNTQRIPI
jgi:hypothetical protein